MFEQARSAIDSLEVVARGLDAACLEASDAAALVELAGRGKRVCAAIETLAAGRVADSGAWRAEGHRSAAHWVAEHTGETIGAATRALETAHALEDLPDTAAAFRGRVSRRRALRSAGGRDRFGRD